jgi:molybdopterin guanine dinucleotide-containing S/N-oxide reductase-like protein
MNSGKEVMEMSDGKGKKVDVKPDKTVIKALALGGLLGGGGECVVDVKDGRAVRIRPFHYDWKYDKKQFNAWKIQRNGKTLEPLMKALPSPFSLAYKKRTYSPNRIKYPMKRVDWDPNGERNPQNRGKSKYKRISWEEAANIVASEVKRIHKEYGPLAILVQGDGHGECKTIHTPHGHSGRLFDMMGGFTQQVRNPDSWEGWYWGAKHVWGQGFQGMMSPANNVIKDMSENCDMILCWGCDPETTPWGFTGQYATRICYFWNQAGIKQVYICPDLNYGAAVHADKWIPILPNTDAALQLAIIYVWLTEGNWDKEYVKTHTVGMDKVEDYVMGKEDGIPKTPEWASQKCGVPEWTIKALAREFAAKTTTIAHYFGGSMVRGPFSHEPGRLECVLLGMQGLGGPGIHQCQITYFGMPRAEGLKSTRFFNPQLSERLKIPCRTTSEAWGKQLIPKTLIQEAILRPPLTFMGSGGQESPVEDQFIKYTYPLPKEEGGTEVHMIWTDTPCRITCWNHGNWTVEAFRSPKIECVVAQHPWLENECLYADIVLPSNTTLEVEDIITNVRQGPHFHSVAIQEQAIQPIGESKSDYEVVLEVAKRLGMEESFTEGKTVKDLEKQVFENMELQNFITWEDFEDKKYFVFPVAKDWESDPPGFRLFYEDPEKNPLPTPTGKLEFYSERLAQHFPDDKERPPYPKWIEKSVTHDERLTSERASMFPLLLMSNHGRWRTHAQCDDIAWTREAPTCKVTGSDGYKYEPVWINPKDAEKRGINDGDIVKIFNERGIVLVGARVWERVMPGVVYVDHGARHDPIIPGKVDRGGAINTIAPLGITSKNCVGQATSGYLVDVQKLRGEEMDEWRKQYPDAFEREYDAASGLRFNAWIED